MAVYNGFKYPQFPSHLPPLDILSERLISPRIPFMQIRRLRHVNGQYGILGQIINVPVDVDTMIKSLPRNVDDDYCINVHIKRKQIHKSSYLQGIINKRTIKTWLQFLLATPLYTMYEIKMDQSFFDNNSISTEIPLEDISEHIPIEESLTAQQHTLSWDEEQYLCIAPGEQNVPRSLLFDEHAEELSFPSIYLGEFRRFREGIKATPFMMASSELRRSDRRAVTPHHLLYVAMKIMRLRVRDSLTIAFKHVGKNTTVTRQQIEDEHYINNCIETNLAFLRSIPNSTWYWSNRKKDLFAMIRQLGKPTIFFLTLSANEIGWTDLIQILYTLKHSGVEISTEAAENLHYLEKLL
ncbi:ATP-dependent DNA helicase [Trichonephila clavipes]|nr:ATP-dependent DNA helicase [Trichonephila clavipes]